MRSQRLFLEFGLRSKSSSVVGSTISERCRNQFVASFNRGTRCFSTDNGRRVIDFRSDTVTSPSPEMLRAALTAPTGDDVMGEDPTVLELQNYMASLFQKDAALYVPTGTMANLVAIMAHCHGRASELIVGVNSHIALWEGGNTAGLAGVHSRQLPEDPLTAQFHLQTVQDTIRSDDDDHYAKTELICLENTQNELGGVALEPKFIQQIGQLAHSHDVKLHIDGARICNAAVAKGNISLDDYCAPADSISVCLSKGLGAPLGSVLVADEETIRLAKRARKRCGGGMRQAGVVAAMGLYAIQKHYPEKIAKDHARAKRIAKHLVTHGFELTRNGQVDTNMFYFQLPAESAVSNEEFAERLWEEHGIKIYGGYSTGGKLFRLVTHLDLTDEDVDTAAQAMVQVCKV